MIFCKLINTKIYFIIIFKYIYITILQLFIKFNKIFYYKLYCIFSLNKYNIKHCLSSSKFNGSK